MTRSSTSKVMVGILAATVAFGTVQSPLFAAPKATTSKGSTTVASATPRTAPEINMEEGTPFVQNVLEVARGLNDYTFNCEIATYKKQNQPIREGGSFEWKKPGMLRAEVTKGGKKGGVLVKQADGTIKGHLGGMLKMFVAKVQPDSNMLKSANGFSMLEGDYLTLMNNLKKQLAGPLQVRVSSAPVTVSSQQEKVHVVEVFKKTGEGEQITQKVYVDPQLKLPVEWHLFREDGSLLSITYWSNIKLNVGIADSEFTL